MTKFNTYNKNLKCKEELMLDLEEVIAYRELEHAEFIFGNETISNTNKYKLGSEDAYYEMYIESLEEILYDLENNYTFNSQKRNHKINHYQKKMYWRKNKLVEQIKISMPWWSYYKKVNENGNSYYKRCYQSTIESKKLYCRLVRRALNSNIDEDYDVCNLKGRSWRKIYDYLWDLW